MEPRSWKWIRAVVIVVTAAVGIGMALWYQNRSLGDSGIVAHAAPPPRKTIPLPAPPDAVPTVVSTAATGVTTIPPAAGPAPDTAGASADAARQRTSVDPMTHLAPPPPVATAPGVSAAATPVAPVFTAPAAGAPVSPFQSVTAPPAPTAAPPSSLVPSPVANTAPTEGGLPPP